MGQERLSSFPCFGRFPDTHSTPCPFPPSLVRRIRFLFGAAHANRLGFLFLGEGATQGKACFSMPPGFPFLARRPLVNTFGPIACVPAFARTSALTLFHTDRYSRPFAPSAWPSFFGLGGGHRRGGNKSRPRADFLIFQCTTHRPPFFLAVMALSRVNHFVLLYRVWPFSALCSLAPSSTRHVVLRPKSRVGSFLSIVRACTSQSWLRR